jgi:hypothetical protein
MKKKGQVTLFIFLGVILALILATIIFMIGVASEEQMRNMEDTQKMSQVEMQPVQEYVESCLDIVLQDGLDLIGTQGFALYISQGGIIQDPEIGSVPVYDDRAVTHRLTINPEQTIYDGPRAVVSNSIRLKEIFGDTKLLVYPWAQYPINPVTGLQTDYASSAFGWNDLPPLQRTGSGSIEEQLEEYVQNRINDCTDWSNYPAMKLEIGKPSVQIIFTPKSTVTTLSWPMSLFDVNGREGKLEKFVVRQPVRLAKIHKFVKSLIDEDVSNITFDIDRNNTPYDIFVERGFDEGTVIRVVDKESLVKDRPYEIRFARMNRPPALFRINDTIISLPKNTVCQDTTVSFNGTSLRVISADTASCSIDMNIEARAIDPDEENVTFFIRGKTQLPFQITDKNILSISDCIPYTIVATDGKQEDTQEVNLRLKSINTVPSCY